MFNLEYEIGQWRQRMAAGGVTDPAVLDELESHLRDYVEQRLRSGCEAREAFDAGVARIGQPAALKREFLRADKILSVSRVAAFLDDRRKCRWLAFGLAALVAAGFYARHARVTPLYASVATVELHGVLYPLEGRDIRSAEVLNTSIKLLNSQRVRAKVAASFTHAERNLLFRSAVMGRDPAEQQPITGILRPIAGNWLGTLTIRAQRLTFLLTISVNHEAPEAAALIANRYVREWQAELASSTNFEGISVREIDVATPSRDPVSPNLKRILQAALGLGVIIFVALVAVAALLRKLVQTRPGVGPQLKTE